MNAGFSSLGPGAEFDRIRLVWNRLAQAAEGGGDDCAIVQFGSEKIAISVDSMVEDTHFRVGWLEPGEIGWRAAAAALSDLAAVAASPRGVLVALGLNPEYPEDFSAEIMSGAAAAAKAVDAKIWGGDLFRCDKMMLNVTVVGGIDGKVLRRDGASPGDQLYVTGRLGGPAQALNSFLARGSPEASARERFARPVPRVAEAKWLRDRGATAMIDISDGLVADAEHLAAASSVKLVVNYEKVPVHPAVENPDAALVGGEEYELLFAVAGESATLSADFRDAFNLDLSCIGRVEQGNGVQVFKGGGAVQIQGGYLHF